MHSEAKRVVVILNPHSGLRREGAPRDLVEAALRAVGLEPEIIPLEGGMDAAKIIGERVQAGCGTVVAAGGDGTINTVGSALAGTETALGVLPTGTLNHFARDLGIPLELEQAARVIAKGQTTRVDVAEVNGRVFLNNSSLGLYPTLVREREKLMKRGIPKTLALCAAASIALWRFPNTAVRVTAGDTGVLVRTPLVFVGNNEYEFAGLEAGTRARLNGGILQLCTVAQPTRSALFLAMLLTSLGRAAADLHRVDTQRAKITTFRKHVKVALDGEVIRMTSPLVYVIRPGALKVIVEGAKI
jgi:YegS/Rv2252/BmrU family lipid kinase